ncbi:MAG: polysaccharide deacetylase family protein [Minisyncoccota bacterium]
MRSRFMSILIALALTVGSVALILPYSPGVPAPAEESPTDNPALYAEVATSTPQPLPTVSSSGGLRLPILVYHIVRPIRPTDDAAVRALAVEPELFDAQMNYLKSAGYHVVRFSDLEGHFASSTPLPPKPIIISFDDGWSSQFTYAFPILEKYHYPTTFFVFTNGIGARGFLTWDNLRALEAGGMTIGDHTRSHPYLTSIMSTSTLWDEIAGSKQLLEQKLGVPINEFAYPFGQYNPTIVSLVRQAGYKSARGDFYSGNQSVGRLFTLSALNAPTTLALFERDFP